MADPIVVPNEGKTILLDRAMKGASVGNYTLDLFSTNVTVGNSSTFSAFTIPTFTGYAAITITPASFAAATIVSNQGYTLSSADPFSFVSVGPPVSPVTVYGWIMREASSGKVLFGANFSTARVFAANGDTVQVSIPINDATL